MDDHTGGGVQHRQRWSHRPQQAQRGGMLTHAGSTFAACIRDQNGARDAQRTVPLWSCEVRHAAQLVWCSARSL